MVCFFVNRSVFIYRTQVFSRYHFTCVDLSENDAEDISESLHAPARFCHNSPCVSGLYICPSCHQKTGLCTVSKYLRIAHAAPGLVSVFLHFLRPFNVPRKISCRSCRTLSQVPSLRFLCVRGAAIYGWCRPSEPSPASQFGYIVGFFTHRQRLLAARVTTALLHSEGYMRCDL